VRDRGDGGHDRRGRIAPGPQRQTGKIVLVDVARVLAKSLGGVAAREQGAEWAAVEAARATVDHSDIRGSSAELAVIVVIRREPPRTSGASRASGRSHRTSRGLSFPCCKFSVNFRHLFSAGIRHGLGRDPAAWFDHQRPTTLTPDACSSRPPGTIARQAWATIAGGCP
jgi:hypothetical protein